MIFDRVLDCRMRGLLRKLDVPDLPEVRKMMRLAWWNGFTFGGFERQASAARQEAMDAIVAAWRAGQLTGTGLEKAIRLTTHRRVAGA